METRKVMKGNHSRKTAAFVRVCSRDKTHRLWTIVGSLIFKINFPLHIYGVISFLNVSKRNDQGSLNFNTNYCKVVEGWIWVLCASSIVSIVVPVSGRSNTFFPYWSVPNFEIILKLLEYNTQNFIKATQSTFSKMKFYAKDNNKT